jgi:hypothetical protein
LQTLPVPQLVPLAIGLQVPVEHELHSPQATLQQMPDTQFPFLHWLGEATEQVSPSSFFGVHVPPDAQ